MTHKKYHICFLGFEKLYNLAQEVLASLNESDTVYHLYNCTPDTQDECVHEALDAGCTVFIASSGNAAWFLNHYQYPLVQIRINSIDYAMAAFNAKEAGHKNIGVLRSRFAQQLNLSTIETLLGIELAEITYEGYSELVTSVLNSDCDAIIGAAGAVDAAKRAGKASFDVYFSTDGIRDACMSAAKLAKTLRDRRENREISLAVLNNAQFGVIVTDTDGKITHFNRAAQSYTSITASQACGHNIEEYFPHLSVSACLNQGHSRTDSYRLIDDTMMRCVQECIHLKDEPIAVLTTLYPEAHNRKRKHTKQQGLNSHIYHWNELTSNSDSMCRLIQQAKAVAHYQYPTLIVGEPGTGQEELAYCIHGESARAKYPCITIDLATVASQDVPHLLIGYEKENQTVNGMLLNANYGSIVIKNISLAPRSALACLQEVLNGRQVLFPGMEAAVTLDIRVFTIGLPNELDCLSRDIQRQLSVQKLSLPPLRTRREDIATLFLKYLTKLSNEPIHFSVTPDMELLLCEYSWPGNVWELRAVSARYIIARNEVETISARQKYRLLLKAIGEEEFLNDFAKRAPVLFERPINDYDAFISAFTELKSWMKMSNEVLGELLHLSRTTLWRILNSGNIK